MLRRILRVSKYKSKLDRYSTRESINLCLLVYYLSCPAHLDKFHFGSRTAWKIMEMAFLAAKSRHCLGCEENKKPLTIASYTQALCCTFHSTHKSYSMSYHHQLSCSMITKTPGPTLTTSRQHQLLCNVVNMNTATQTDLLKNHADKLWFVLVAYFFAFFTWTVMNSIDFISEKWRTCRALEPLRVFTLQPRYFLLFTSLCTQKRSVGVMTIRNSALH